MNNGRIERICRELASMAEATGDQRPLRAIVCLRARRGRPAADDASALLEMRDLLQTGRAASVREAAMLVAKTLPGQQTVEATAARLRRKWRETRVEQNEGPY